MSAHTDDPAAVRPGANASRVHDPDEQTDLPPQQGPMDPTDAPEARILPKHLQPDSEGAVTVIQPMGDPPKEEIPLYDPKRDRLGRRLNIILVLAVLTFIMMMANIFIGLQAPLKEPYIGHYLATADQWMWFHLGLVIAHSLGTIRLTGYKHSTRWEVGTQVCAITSISCMGLKWFLIDGTIGAAPYGEILRQEFIINGALWILSRLIKDSPKLLGYAMQMLGLGLRIKLK